MQTEMAKDLIMIVTTKLLLGLRDSSHDRKEKNKEFLQLVCAKWKYPRTKKGMRVYTDLIIAFRNNDKLIVVITDVPMIYITFLNRRKKLEPKLWYYSNL